MEKAKISVIIICDANYNMIVGTDYELTMKTEFFKKLTFGNPIVMGRKLFEQLRKPIQCHSNIVLTHNDLIYKPIKTNGKRVHVAKNIEDVYRLTQQYEMMFIIGGIETIKEFIPIADCIYTIILGFDSLNNKENKFDTTGWYKVFKMEDFEKRIFCYQKFIKIKNLMKK